MFDFLGLNVLLLLSFSLILAYSYGLPFLLSMFYANKGKWSLFVDRTISILLLFHSPCSVLLTLFDPGT